MEKRNAVQNTTWLERPCCHFMPLVAGSLYALLSVVIPLLSATASCAATAPDEISSALQSAAQFFLVMRNGKIIQKGTHTSLMHEDGYYKKFIQNL